MNQLFYGDNLGVLREHVKDESVDLIYLDPPFNSKRDYNLLFKSPAGHESEAQITAFEDSWHWGREAELEFDEILHQPNTDVAELVKALRAFLGENDVMAYLTMMAIRLIELHRVLKPTGSLYLHCDPTASHYLKLVLDAIFGIENFLNEIIWSYRRWPSVAKSFQRMHDVIFFYCKNQGATRTFNVEYEANSESYIKRFKGKTQILDPETGTRKIPVDKESRGLARRDVWDISIIAGSSHERLDYPTQKPIVLLERIINASSNPGDLVLDPFCGCGTAVHAAQKLGRRWIGIDVTCLAISVVEKRLNDAFNEKGKPMSEQPCQFEVHGTPKDLESAGDLAKRDKYQFQWWAVSLVEAQPFQGKKKGADTGIDGLKFFRDIDQKDARKIVVSVKGGGLKADDVRALNHVREREGADIALFVSLEPPTKGMVADAASAGFYESPNGKKYARVQLLTIEGLLNKTQRAEHPDYEPDLNFKKPKAEPGAMQSGLKL
jgi:site-specific DNA-methyltransferase (adenine-specific)